MKTANKNKLTTGLPRLFLLGPVGFFVMVAGIFFPFLAGGGDGEDRQLKVEKRYVMSVDGHVYT